MKNDRLASLPALAFAGGTQAMTLTPVVGTPQREYADMFVPGEESLADCELRVTVLGSGNPWPTRAQASTSMASPPFLARPSNAPFRAITASASGFSHATGSVPRIGSSRRRMVNRV